MLAKQKIKKKRGRGRPATGFDPMVGVRMPIEVREEIEAWGAEQSPALKLSEAIRRLVDIGLAAAKPRRPAKRKGEPR
jgi:hypothetical protein